MNVVPWRHTVELPNEGIAMDAVNQPSELGASTPTGTRGSERIEMPSVPGFSHTIVETPGLRTHVATVGEGEPLVMLHGLPEHWWQWRTIGPTLGRHYRVICPDLRGAGWTRAESPRMGRLTQMEDLIAVMDALKLDRVRLVEWRSSRRGTGRPRHDHRALPRIHSDRDGHSPWAVTRESAIP